MSRHITGRTGWRALEWELAKEMKDRILESYLKDFVEQYSLGDLNESTSFEHLVGHCIISKHSPENFEPDDVIVGGAGDLGLDAVGIVVNDYIVRSKSDVDYFKTTLRRLDVQFIFAQAKTGRKFSAAEIGTFFSGVRHFFSENLPDDANEDVKNLHKLKEYIYDHTIDMDTTPVCRMYYVTTGEWSPQPALTSRIKQGKNDLDSTGLFSEVFFTPMGSEGIRQTYRELHQKVTQEVKFEKHTILPSIVGVDEAYIGILPCLEYLNLICDEQGNLNRRLFYDNVRDFQGHNTVNQEIETTIKTTEQKDRFALLNNGVTIVARDANKVGVMFRLRDYQIVNGCQTSHILHLNRESLTETVFLPVKLIVTGDAEVTNHIIQGTNRQTEVKIEAFESLAPFQKELEEFYTAVGRDRKNPVYYERRSKQYEHMNVRREKIITLATQVKCFVAMFLNEPQSTHRYYGELLNSYRNRIFGASHAQVAYFTAGVCLNAIEGAFSRGQLPRELRRFKYHFLMVFRLMNEPFNIPYINKQKRMNEYCQALIDIMDDEASCAEAFSRASDVISSCQKTMLDSTYSIERTRVFTKALVDASNERGEPTRTSRVDGIVKQFSDTLGYGFIAGDDQRDYFVHYSQIAGRGFRSLEMGQKVEFTPIQTERGPQATDVEIEEVQG